MDGLYRQVWLYMESTQMCELVPWPENRLCLLIFCLVIFEIFRIHLKKNGIVLTSVSYFKICFSKTCLEIEPVTLADAFIEDWNYNNVLNILIIDYNFDTIVSLVHVRTNLHWTTRPYIYTYNSCFLCQDLVYMNRELLDRQFNLKGGVRLCLLPGNIPRE